MIAFLVTTIKIVFVLGFLILIHEGGHFLVARLCKVTVNEFSIGFGPIILKKQGKNTKYSLRLIPLGGFVNLEGEEERSEVEGSFSKASIPKRMAIVIAGGLVNIIFAIIVYFALMLCLNNHMSLVVESTIPDYAAQIYGIEENDEIIKIEGKNVYTKSDIDKILQNNNGNEMTITVKRNNEQLEIKLIPTKQEYENTEIYQYYIGVYFAKAEKTVKNNIYFSLFETKDFFLSIFENLKMLCTGQVKVNQFMGPIGISEVVANTNKIADFVNILALISLSLGVTNLLPIPALDGGKLLLLIIEAIRGKKLSEKTEINIQLMGFAFLITLSLYIAYNDILRIL